MKTAGINQNREQRTIYEVRRYRESGEKGRERTAEVEAFPGLDRARLAALGYALDGPTSTGERFTGRVEVHRVLEVGEKRVSTALVDLLDERVACRVLNELALPRADALSVSVDRLQEEANRLTRLGF